MRLNTNIVSAALNKQTLKVIENNFKKWIESLHLILNSNLIKFKLKRKQKLISKRAFQIDIQCSFQKTIKNVEKHRDVKLQPQKKELFSIKTKLSHKHFLYKYLLVIEMTNNVMKK